MSRRPRDTSLILALCGSLSLHGVLALAVSLSYVPGSSDATRPASTSSSSPLPTRDDQSPIFILPPKPRPVPRLHDDNSEFGEQDGTGFAINSAPGDAPQYTREGPEDQAFLSKDPEGPGHRDNLPSMSLAPEGGNGSGGGGGTAGDAGRAGSVRSMPAAAPPALHPLAAAGEESLVGVTAALSPAVPPAPAMVVPKPPAVAAAPTPAPMQPAPAPPQPVATTPPQPPLPAAAGGPGGTGRPGPAVPPADPAPQSDSESDPFAKIGSVTFSAGRIDARCGRKIKATRPRLTLAGKYDLAALQFPSLVLQVKIDTTGRVTDVHVAESSGSNEIDQPCLVAVYEWWIEPPKDKAGQPLASELELHLTWHGS